jgi:hypothetical protein
VEYVGVNLAIRIEDLDNAPFIEKGGKVDAMRQLGREYAALLEDLNMILVR